MGSAVPCGLTHLRAAESAEIGQGIIGAVSGSARNRRRRMTRTAKWYDDNAGAVSESYESVFFEEVHGWLIDLLPVPPAAVLDVGAGSGRDAAWLSKKGYDVVAVEPSAKMRKAAEALHPGLPIRWLSDSLPELRSIFRAGLPFDFILLSAVWMHVAPAQRDRAFRKLISLLKPGGVMAVTLRDGPDDSGRVLHPTSAEEIEILARNHGAYIHAKTVGEDRLGRDAVRWTRIAIRLPDDNSGSLALLRHVILHDNKSSSCRTAARLPRKTGGNSLLFNKLWAFQIVEKFTPGKTATPCQRA